VPGLIHKGYAVAFHLGGTGRKANKKILKFVKSLKQNSEYRKRVIDLPGLDMQGLMALIARADIVISIDTGPMHLAVAMNRPTIGLMPLHRHKFDWTPQGADNFVAVRKPAIDEITSEEILGAEVLLRSKFPHKASSAIEHKKLNSPIVLSSILK
jgi:ADP-heptose:LPS heptosyltransferase